jgi:ATP-dependent helicase HrpA
MRSLRPLPNIKLETSVGHGVGVKIRFHQQIADHTVIKVLTNGMLLAEIQQSALLTEYDTIY